MRPNCLADLNWLLWTVIEGQSGQSLAVILNSSRTAGADTVSPCSVQPCLSALESSRN